MYRHAVVNTPVARWVLIARGTADGTAATSPPGTESCWERWKRSGNCGLRILEWGSRKSGWRMANAGWRMTDGG